MPLSSGDAVKLLLRAGFHEINQVGSHRKFGKGMYRITVVYHGNKKESLSRGVEKGILKILKEIRNDTSTSNST